jgi:poly(hydroxyalkanoate) depolymerase family esterase
MRRIFLVLFAVSIMIGANVSGAATEENRRLGGFNSVIIYTPTTQSPLGGRSLMLVLHGCTQPNTAFRTANLQAAADKHGMVIAVPDAAHKAGFACWDYWTGAPNRNLKDYKNLIALANAMVADSKYQIDKDQVYIAGLSSGGAFAMNTGCLAPDVFAGIGLVGSPSAGTSSSGAIGVQEGSPQIIRQKCESFAGVNKPHFQTQITVSAFGTGDYVVSKGYGPQNASAMALVYGHSDVSVSENLPKANVKVNSQKTVALVELIGESHAWPGGPGASGSYIGSASINFADYLAGFFNANNRRTTGGGNECTVPGPIPTKPVDLQLVNVVDTLAEFSVKAEKDIVKYRVQLLNTSQVIGEPSARENNGVVEFKVTGLKPNTHYQVQVIAIDNCDQESAPSDPISFTTTDIVIVYPSVTGTATDHYVAGRLDVTAYVAMGGKHGYATPITLWEVNGQWTDVDPYGGNDDNIIVPPVKYTVSTLAGTGGSISPTSRQVTKGEGATFTITPNSGYLIDSVTGCSGKLSGSTYTITDVSGNCTVSANFKKEDLPPPPAEYTVTASVGAGSGTVSPTSQKVLDGKSAKITLTPASGYEFDSFTGCSATRSGNTITVSKVTESCGIVVNFKKSASTPPSFWDLIGGWFNWF